MSPGIHALSVAASTLSGFTTKARKHAPFVNGFSPRSSPRNPIIPPKSPYVLTPSAIQVYRASVPEEGFAMCVQQNATDCNTRKRCLHLPGWFGTGVRFGEGRNSCNSRAESRARNNLQQFATKNKGCFGGTFGGVPKCPEMSAPAKDRSGCSPRWPASGVRHIGRTRQKSAVDVA